MHDRARTISLTAVLSRGWPWIVAMALLGGLLAGGVGLMWPKSYSTSAVLILDEQQSNRTSMETEQLVASSSEIMGLAGEELGLSARAVGQAVTVTVPRGALALRFTATGDDPQRVAMLANATATAYRDQDARGQQPGGQDRIAAVEGRIEELTELLGKVPPGSPRARVVAAELSASEEELLDLQLRASEPHERGRLVSPAAVPSSPSTPGTLVFVAGGLAAGTIAGSVLALLGGRRSLVAPRTLHRKK